MTGRRAPSRGTTAASAIDPPMDYFEYKDGKLQPMQ